MQDPWGTSQVAEAKKAKCGYSLLPRQHFHCPCMKGCLECSFRIVNTRVHLFKRPLDVDENLDDILCMKLVSNAQMFLQAAYRVLEEANTEPANNAGDRVLWKRHAKSSLAACALHIKKRVIWVGPAAEVQPTECGPRVHVVLSSNWGTGWSWRTRPVRPFLAE
jgi:hypothetical protein